MSQTNVQNGDLHSPSQTTRATVPPPPARAFGHLPPAPAALQPGHFAGYPTQARLLATSHIALLRTIPLPLLPVLLREVAAYDYKFPVERTRLARQLAWLTRLTPAQRIPLFAPFAALTFSPALDRLDWINDPAAYMEQLTAELWSSGFMPRFREASAAYAEAMRTALPEILPARPRLCLVVLGDDLRAANGSGARFQQLRSRGVLLTGIDPTDGFTALLDRVHARSAESAQSTSFAHWYVDGGLAEPVEPHIATASYSAMEPVRRKLLARAGDLLSQERSGPEELRSLMAQIKPGDVGLSPHADPVLTHFQLTLMTEGSGTQVFATTFVQWAAREILRRAEPETLLLRFRPRQRQQGMNELMTGSVSLGPDLPGSLIDAEQGAYSTWLNLQRLPGAEQAVFLAWQQGSREAVALGPGLPAGGTSPAGNTLHHVLNELT